MLNRNEKYGVAILSVIEKAGGRKRSTEVIEAVMPMVSDVLTDWDYELIGGATLREPRAHNHIRWVRQWMVHESGLLRKGSPHGVWEITDAGRRYLEEHSA